MENNKQKHILQDARVNGILFLVPLITLVVAYCLGKSFETAAFLIWGGGGIYAFWILMKYGYTDSVSSKTKESAMWFLFGDLIVFFIFCLKPV